MTARRNEHRGTERPLSALHHRHGDLVLTRVHSHAGGSCLEVFVVEGPARDIETFVTQLRAANGVARVD